MSSKHTNNTTIIAIYVTKGTTNIYEALSFVLHIGMGISASEINTK